MEFVDVYGGTIQDSPLSLPFSLFTKHLQLVGSSGALVDPGSQLGNYFVMTLITLISIGNVHHCTMPTEMITDIMRLLSLRGPFPKS